MGSIYVCSNRDSAKPRILELSDDRITPKDIERLKKVWPKNVSGLYFKPPIGEFEDPSQVEVYQENNGPRVALYLAGIAEKLLKGDQLDSAFQFYDLVVALTGNPAYQIKKAKVLFDMGQVEKASQLLQSFIKDYPQDPEAWYIIARIALSLNEWASAKDAFRHALQFIQPQNVENLKFREPCRIFMELVSLLLARDTLHTYDYTPDQYLKAIVLLRDRANNLQVVIKQSKSMEVKGIEFSLDGLVKTFDNWVQELETPR